MEDASIIHERPIGQVRGVRDWPPNDFERLADLERFLLCCFESAGYRQAAHAGSWSSPNCMSARAARGSFPSCLKSLTAQIVRSACDPN